jgi:hypothetical protein
MGLGEVGSEGNKESGAMVMRLAVIAILLVLLLNVGCISIGNNADGIATDSIARVSYGGWIWKTWRVQLTNDHPIEGNQMTYGVVHDQELIDQLQHYASTGKKVKLYYRSNMFVWDWEYSDAEVIYKVEAVE